MATIIVGLIAAAVLFLAARQLYKDKKSGKSSCGGNCAGCPRACEKTVKKPAEHILKG